MTSKKDFVFFPALAWLLALFAAYKILAPFYQENFTSDHWVFFIILIVVERLATAIAVVEICKRQLLNSDRWFLTALVFGLNTLLFINIWIWVRPNKK